MVVKPKMRLWREWQDIKKQFNEVTVDRVRFDQKKGLGADDVSKRAADIDLIVYMYPERFLQLTQKEKYDRELYYEFRNKMRTGQAIAPPYMVIDMTENIPRIIDHAGRHRARAFRAVAKNGTKMPVIIKLDSMKSDMLVRQDIKKLAGEIEKENGRLVSGPQFNIAYTKSKKFDLTPPKKHRHGGQKHKVTL